MTLSRLLPDPGPARALTYATLTSSVGRGLFMTASVVFFYRWVGLSATEVGTGLTIAALVALLAGVPAGHLADRVGPRAMTVAFGLGSATAISSYFLARDWWVFVAIATCAAVCQAAQTAARGALIAGSVPAEQRVRTRAYLRAVTNLGWTLGAPLAGFALAHDTALAYFALIGTTGALAGGGALLNLRVPAPRRAPSAARRSMTAALRDRPYLTLAALNAVLTIHYGVINVAIPLWVVERTAAPVWIISVLVVLNTTCVVVFQVYASRGTHHVPTAAKAQRLSGGLLLLACVGYALAAGQPAWAAILALVVGALFHVAGELLQAAGGWGISFELAPEHAQGQYQGLYNTGFQVADVVAPAVLTTVVIGWGPPGWILLGLAFAGAGSVIPVAARWAQRTRAVETVTIAS